MWDTKPVKILCPRDDDYHEDRPNYLFNRRLEEWNGLPSWHRYCKFVRAYGWRWNLSDMEVIEKFAHLTIKEWAEELEWDYKKSMNPWI